MDTVTYTAPSQEKIDAMKATLADRGFPTGSKVRLTGPGWKDKNVAEGTLADLTITIRDHKSTGGIFEDALGASWFVNGEPGSHYEGVRVFEPPVFLSPMSDLQAPSIPSTAVLGGELVARIKDSGTRRDFGTGSVRDAQEGKGRMDLLPVRALLRLARHFEKGSKKYGDRNWEKGQPLSAYYDSGLRHLLKWWGGLTDEDHLAAGLWNIICAVETQERIERGLLPAELDDMPPAVLGNDEF